MPTPHFPMQTLLLAAGERRVLRAATGSRWIVLRGELRWSDAPRWLGERLVSIELEFAEGTEHLCERGGWIALQARTASTLVCQMPWPIGARLRAAWRIILASAVQRGAPALADRREP